MHRHCVHAVRRNTNAYSTVANAFDRSRKNLSPSTKPSENAKKRSSPPKLTFKPKKTNVSVPHSPTYPKKKPVVHPRLMHPLLLEHNHRAGEWTPSPAKGVNPLPLKRLLLKNRPSADPALNAMTTESMEEVTSISGDTDWIEMSFVPGTFVETRKNESHALAVVLAEVIEDHKWKIVSLASNGEVFLHLRQDVQFAITGFVSSDLAARCGTERITNDLKAVNARVEVLKRLKQLKMNVEASYNADGWTRQRHVNIHRETRSVDPTRWAKTTVRHVAHLMWQQPKYFHYYAVHKYLMEHPLQFVAADNCLKSQTFYVRPLRDVEEIETVGRWIGHHRRDEVGEFSRFVHKARQVIDQYGATQQRNVSGPMSQKVAKHSWNEEDQVFLRVLLRSLAPWRSVQKDPYEVIKVSLMKCLYPQIHNVPDVAIFQCLKELGVIAPWHDPFESTHYANPSGDFYTPDSYKKENEALSKRTFQNKPVAGAVLGPDDLHSSDPLDSVRHDFGDMNVFVIDEAKAEELDDGISVERIPSEPGKFWVHAHIADPASLLHPGHHLSLRARDRGSTLYFRQRTFHLFPSALIHDPDYGLSLGTRSRAGCGDNTLTFSTKLDMEGNILDHKIRAGIIRKVRKVTYNNCDMLLGLKPLLSAYPFGRGHAGDSDPPATFAKAEADDLKLLFQLTQQQVKRRFSANIFMFDMERASVNFLTAPERVGIQSPSMKGSTFGGFPEMEYAVTSSANLDQGSRMIVSEMMKLASRVASRVALENGIPLIRRALDPIVPATDESAEAMLQARSPNGYVSMYKFIKHTAMTPTSVYTLEAKRHCGVGIPDGEGYSRATSPLRRFEDLVVHWQLHHVLLGPKAPAKYPFSLSEMEGLCIDIATVDKTNRKLHQGDDLFHNLLFMKHRMENREEKHNFLRDGTLTAYNFAEVKKDLLTNTFSCSVMIPKLGMKAQLVDLRSDFFKVPLSSALQVRVKNIDLAVNRLALHVTLA